MPTAIKTNDNSFDAEAGVGKKAEATKKSRRERLGGHKQQGGGQDEDKDEGTKRLG